MTQFLFILVVIVTLCIMITPCASLHQKDVEVGPCTCQPILEALELLQGLPRSEAAGVFMTIHACFQGRSVATAQYPSRSGSEIQSEERNHRQHSANKKDCGKGNGAANGVAMWETEQPVSNRKESTVEGSNATKLHSMPDREGVTSSKAVSKCQRPATDTGTSHDGNDQGDEVERCNRVVGRKEHELNSNLACLHRRGITQSAPKGRWVKNKGTKAGPGRGGASWSVWLGQIINSHGPWPKSTKNNIDELSIFLMLLIFALAIITAHRREARTLLAILAGGLDSKRLALCINPISSRLNNGSYCHLAAVEARQVTEKAYIAEESREFKKQEDPRDGNTAKSVPDEDYRLGEIVADVRTYVEDEYVHKLEHPPSRPNSPASPGEHWYQRPISNYPPSSRRSHLQSDGRISDAVGDPPGQQTIYIRPGDARSEAYRLSTFESFPSTNHQMRRNLAKAGFVFTGYFDRVKCFTCGRCVEQLSERDNPFDQIWHKPECMMARGVSGDNVPLATGFTSVFPGRANSTGYQNEQILQQRDPISGAVTRTVRYPADLPDRIRRNGGTFQIAPGNMVIIQSGPGPGHNPPAAIGNHSAPARWRMANVVSADHRRFLNNLYLNRELDRLSSFARWPISRPNVSPACLAKNGFFYLGDMDRTQCFSCGGVLRNWTLEDDAEEEHRTHFPNCRFTQGLENRNIPIPARPEPSNELLTNYPCRYAASPHMRTKQARLETFNMGWINGRVSATPEAIADAGFFFLGERDRVKCWYCNGGLQNWEYEDQPWHEHAKWFPNCQFLLQMKGQSFVFQHLAMNPHLARPIIARQEGSPLAEAEQPGAVARPMDVAPARQQTPPPLIIDPREEMRKQKEKVDEIMRSSDVVKNVVGMGFSKDLVRQVIEEQVESEGSGQGAYESVAALLDIVLAKEEEFKRETEASGYQGANDLFSYSSSYSGSPSVGACSSIGTAPGSGLVNNFSFEEGVMMDVKENAPDIYTASEPLAANSSAANVNFGVEGLSVQEKLRKLQEERMCKICFSKDADIAFIPCGHMCCCAECTQSIRQCPMCRQRIDKAIKTYVT